MKIIKGSRQLAVTSLAVLVVLLISLSWALADTSPSLEEWNRTFGGSQDDWGMSVQETSDGGYIIVGHTMSFGAGEGDVYLVKTDSQGREAWNRTFGGFQDDWGMSVQETSDGGYIIVGHTMSFGAGEGDVYLVKIDSQGRETWSTTFGGAQDDGGQSVQETSDGGYIIAGYTLSFGAGGRDVYLVKVDQGGVEETYTASIFDHEAPSEVYAGASFTVELTVSYCFTIPTEINAGIRDVEAETWITGDPEPLVGEGTKIYSFELTAPEEETTWVLEVRVGYSLEGEWTHSEVGYSDVFEVSVVEEEDVGGVGIPGFPILSIAFGLIIVLLLRDRFHV